MSEKLNNLTQLQEKFCVAYIANRFNGTRAAETAGYEGDENTLAVTASRLLRITKIKNTIKNLQKKYFDDKEKVGRAVIAELYNLGMRRMSDIVDREENGRVTVKKFEEMGGFEAAINKIEVKETAIKDSDGADTNVVTTETKVWLEGKTKPLELLAKYSGVIVDRQEIDHNINKVEEVKVTVVDPKKDGEHDTESE